MSRRSGTFKEFQEHTLAIARGERAVDPNEPKVWSEPVAKERDAGPMPVPALGPSSFHYLHSTLRERIVEHLFVGEVLRALWNKRVMSVAVLRSEFDAGGFDLVMSYGKIDRHIQFKSSVEGGTAAGVNISLKLMAKPSGCVIWVVVSDKLELKSYRWLGAAPGQALQDISTLKIPKAPKANAKGVKAEKPNQRVVPLNRFEKLDTVDAVLTKLFGPLP